MSAPRIDEIEPALGDDEPDPVPMVSVMALICEPDGTDRSSRITLPADSGDAAIVAALREVAVGAARLRGVPTDVADWYTTSPVDLTVGTAELRAWVTRHIVTGHRPTVRACQELLCLLLHRMNATVAEPR